MFARRSKTSRTLEVFLVALCAGIQATAQERITPMWKGAGYIELAGNGGTLISFNYERTLHARDTARWNFCARIGIALRSAGNEEGSLYSLPLEGMVLYGRSRHFLELGLGGTSYYVVLKDEASDHVPGYGLVGVFRCGYRHVSENGFLFRLAPLGMVDLVGSSGVGLSGGISLGFVF